MPFGVTDFAAFFVSISRACVVTGQFHCECKIDNSFPACTQTIEICFPHNQCRKLDSGQFPIGKLTSVAVLEL